MADRNVDIVSRAFAIAKNTTEANLLDANHPINDKGESGKEAGAGLIIGSKIFVAIGSEPSDTWVDITKHGTGGGGSGTVESVNHKDPDANGNVQLTPADVGAFNKAGDTLTGNLKMAELTKILTADGHNLLANVDKTVIGSVDEDMRFQSTNIPTIRTSQGEYTLVVDNQAVRSKNYARRGDGTWVDIATLLPAADLTGYLKTVDADARYIKVNGGGKLESSYLDLDQDSGIRVLLTDDQGADRDVADVIGATDGMDGRIEVGSPKAGLTLNTRGAVEVYDDATQQHANITVDNMANTKKNYVRSGTGHWIDLQPLLDAIAGSGGTPPDLTGFLTKDEAAQEYLTKALAGTTYDAKPTNLKTGFLYARATDGYHPLPELRKPVGVMHVDNTGAVTGHIDDNYAINILSIENHTYDYQMDYTPKDGDIFVLINDGEKPEHLLGWSLPSGTTVKGYHSYNLNPGFELWTKYDATRKEFIIFRENLAQVNGQFEGTKSAPSSTKKGAISVISTKGNIADFDSQSGTLTLDFTQFNDIIQRLAALEHKVGITGETGTTGSTTPNVPNVPDTSGYERQRYPADLGVTDRTMIGTLTHDFWEAQYKKYMQGHSDVSMIGSTDPTHVASVSGFPLEGKRAWAWVSKRLVPDPSKIGFSYRKSQQEDVVISGRDIQHMPIPYELDNTNTDPELQGWLLFTKHPFEGHNSATVKLVHVP